MATGARLHVVAIIKQGVTGQGHCVTLHHLHMAKCVKAVFLLIKSGTVAIQVNAIMVKPDMPHKNIGRRVLPALVQHIRMEQVNLLVRLFRLFLGHNGCSKRKK